MDLKLVQTSLLSMLVLRIEVKSCAVVLIQILVEMGEVNPKYLKPRVRELLPLNVQQSR